MWHEISQAALLFEVQDRLTLLGPIKVPKIGLSYTFMSLRAHVTNAKTFIELNVSFRTIQQICACWKIH